MDDATLLHIELMNGPLEGHMITTAETIVWGGEADALHAAVWDQECATACARFSLREGRWWVEAIRQDVAVYRAGTSRLVGEATALAHGDILRAGLAWVRVRLAARA